MVKTILLKGQRGFTLIELMAVIAILTVLAGLVAAGVTGLGSSSQAAKLEGDANTIEKAANRFATDAFPATYPIKRPAEAVVSGIGTVGVIDFEAALPQDPTRKFVPKYLARVPDSAGLVSWRIDTATGKVFSADEAALLILPSTNRLDVSAATSGLTSAVSDYKLELSMKKNEAALKVLSVEIPPGYAIGGASIAAATDVGTLNGTFATDNPWASGQEIKYTGALKTTTKSHEWDLVVNYDANTCGTGCTNQDVKNSGASTRTHKVKITLPSLEVGGELTLTMDRATDPDQNEATETFKLILYGKSGNSPSGTTIITNPTVKKVYRWLAQEHTAIDPVVASAEVFHAVAGGNQAVVVRAATSGATPTPGPTPTPTLALGATPTPGPTPTPTPTPTPAPGTGPAPAPNTAPVAESFPIGLDEDQHINFGVFGSDAEPFSILKFELVTKPAHGTLFFPDGTTPIVTLIGIRSNELFGGVGVPLTYKPNLNYNGPDSFTYTVNDGIATSPAATISINVLAVNDAPVADLQTLASKALEGIGVTITLTGSDVDAGTTLTFTVTSLPAAGVLTLPDGQTVIPSTTLPRLLIGNSVVYRPGPRITDTDSFQFKVSDGTLASGLATVTIPR